MPLPNRVYYSNLPQKVVFNTLQQLCGPMSWRARRRWFAQRAKSHPLLSLGIQMGVRRLGGVFLFWARSVQKFKQVGEVGPKICPTKCEDGSLHEWARLVRPLRSSRLYKPLLRWCVPSFSSFPTAPTSFLRPFAQVIPPESIHQVYMTEGP